MSRNAPPPAPPGFDPQSLFAGIPWHQKWELFKGVFTPGRNPVCALADHVGLPDDLTGLRVLDVGAFNCCLSFECERRGAAEVVALDLQPPEQLGFPQLKRALGSERVRFENGSAYALDARALGRFDVVLFFGVLYHLRYPLLALDQLRKVTQGALYLETLVIDRRFLAEGKDGQFLAKYHPALTNVPLWQFYRADELAGDFSNWFGPNIRAVLDGLESAGFDAELISQWGDRAGFRARPSASLDESFRKSYEGLSDLVQQHVGLVSAER
jgi:tRNA (mo5U34)-methyltransferase